MRRLTPLVLSLALLATVAPPARGYVRTVTEDGGNPIWWDGSCVFLTPSSDTTTQVDQTAFLAAIQAAAVTWTQVGCSYLRFVVDPPEPGLEAEFDDHGQNRNVVLFRENAWPYDPAAAGLTTITYLASGSASVDGKIVDADVELNGLDFQFTTSGDPDEHDVQNVLTHELGHVVGLDHTCDDGVIDPTPVDDTGQTIPGCYPAAQLSSEIRQATMYNFAQPGEVDKRTLEPDDQAGVCAIYPVAADPGRCEPVPPIAPRTCACAPAGATPGNLLLWLLVLGVLAYRRRPDAR